MVEGAQKLWGRAQPGGEPVVVVAATKDMSSIPAGLRKRLTVACAPGGERSARLQLDAFHHGSRR